MALVTFLIVVEGEPKILLCDVVVEVPQKGPKCGRPGLCFT